MRTIFQPGISRCCSLPVSWLPWPLQDPNPVFLLGMGPRDRAGIYPREIRLGRFDRISYNLVMICQKGDRMRRLSLRGRILLSALLAAGCMWVFGRQLLTTNVVGGRGGRTFADFQAPSDARVSEGRIQSGGAIHPVRIVYARPD